MPDSGKNTFLTRRDRWGHGMAVWVIAAVVLALPLIFWALGKVDMHNDVAGWLPQDDPQAKILAWYRSSFPTEDRILVSWDDCSITDPRMKQVQDHLEGRFNEESGKREGGSPYVEAVSLPSGLIRRMLDRGIPFDTSMDQVRGLLCGPGPLRVRLTEAGRDRGEQLSAEILQAVNQVLPVEARLIDSQLEEPDSDGIPLEDESAWRYSDSLTAWVREQPKFDLSLSWPNMHADDESRQLAIDQLKQLTTPSGDSGSAESCVEDIFFIEGSQAALTITLSDAGAAEHEDTLAAVREACLDSGVSEDNLRLGGRPVVSAELDHAVGRAGWNPAYELWMFPYRSPILCSTLISIILALWLLRSVRLAVLVQATAVLVVLASVSIVPVTGGSMNMVLVVMPTLLAVLTTSAAIHLCNYWKHSSAQDEDGSVIEAVQTAWLPCFLASTTTAIGLGSLLVSNLVPVRDFGIYSAIGCILSFLMVLYFLPSLMLYWRRRPPSADELDTHHWNRLGRLLTRVRYPAVAACIIGTALCGYGLQKFRTETKVIRYFPEESRLFQDYVYLEDNLSGIISVDTIVRFDATAQEQMTFVQRAQTVMKLQQKIREHDEISGTLSLASFLDLRDGRELSRGQRARRRQIGARIRSELEDGDGESEGVASLLAVPQETTPAPEEGQPNLNEAGDELWRISAQAAILSDIDLQVLTDELDAIATAELTGLRGRDKKRNEVDVEGVGHVVTGLIPIFLRTQQAVLESLIRSFGLAFILIAIVMMVLLRSVRAGLLTMLPNLMPVIVVFGLLSWGELRVDIGTMITASVALGIAVDGTLHLITWFRELIRRGSSIPDAVAGSLEHCGPAMWQTSAVVGLGMIALLPAELLLISRFGWMLAALIFAALIADIVFLPALLAGPLGTLIQRSVQRSQADTVTPATQDAGSDQRQEAAMSDLQSTGNLFVSLLAWWRRVKKPR